MRGNDWEVKKRFRCFKTSQWLSSSHLWGLWLLVLLVFSPHFCPILCYIAVGTVCNSVLVVFSLCIACFPFNFNQDFIGYYDTDNSPSLFTKPNFDKKHWKRFDVTIFTSFSYSWLIPKLISLVSVILCKVGWKYDKYHSV